MTINPNNIINPENIDKIIKTASLKMKAINSQSTNPIAITPARQSHLKGGKKEG